VGGGAGIDDTKSMISSSDMSMTSNVIIKFNLHKQIKEKLEIDLANRVTTKPKKGINTYFFGDNR
jgi:hypothetical protein